MQNNIECKSLFVMMFSCKIVFVSFVLSSQLISQCNDDVKCCIDTQIYANTVIYSIVLLNTNFLYVRAIILCVPSCYIVTIMHYNAKYMIYNYTKNVSKYR